MELENIDHIWDDLTYSEKNHELFMKQKNLLDMFLEKGAISRDQYEKSLRDLTIKMSF